MDNLLRLIMFFQASQMVLTAFTAWLLIYFLPLIIAVWRRHASMAGIGVSSLLLNWTGVFYLVNMVWALSRK